MLLNAGATLYVGGVAADIKEGIRLAGQAINSGAALKTLEKLIEESNR